MTSNLELILLVLFCQTTVHISALNVTVSRLEQDLFQVGSSNCTVCSLYKGVCTSSDSLCQCTRAYSTFVVRNRTCISAARLTKENNCLSRNDGKSDILAFVDPTISSAWFDFKSSDSSLNCSPRKQNIQYLDTHGVWRLGLKHRELFTVNIPSNGSNSLSLQYQDNGNDGVLRRFSGRIVRVDFICSESQRRSCVLFKVKGNLSDSSPSPGLSTGSPFTEPVKDPNVKDKLSSASIPTTYHKHHGNPTKKVSSGSTVYFVTNGVVSIDNEDDDNEVVSVTIFTVGAVACVLIVCIFAWFIVRHKHRSRQRNESNAPGDIVVENGSTHGVIPMSSIPGTEPVYSELPDVVESTNRNRVFPSTTSLNTITEEPFIVRNQIAYCTLPKARKNTDPLPVLPVPPRVRPRTPEPRCAFRVSEHPGNTKTAKFLDEVNKRGCMSLNRNANSRVRRERSSTDVDLLDDVFFENISSRQVTNEVDENGVSGEDEDEVSGHEDEEDQVCGDRTQMHRSESFYQELHSNDGSRVSLYQSLHDATKESPKTRMSTLERINSQQCYRNNGFILQDELDPEYFVLETTNEEANYSMSESGSLSVCDDEVDWAELPEYHVLEGPLEGRYSERNMETYEDRHSLERDVIDTSPLSSERDSIETSVEGQPSDMDIIQTSLEGSSSERDITRDSEGLYLERDITGALEGPSLKRNIIGAFESPSSERNIIGALEDPSLERNIIGALEGPSLERNIIGALNSPSLGRDITMSPRKLPRSLSDTNLNYSLQSYYEYGAREEDRGPLIELKKDHRIRTLSFHG